MNIERFIVMHTSPSRKPWWDSIQEEGKSKYFKNKIDAEDYLNSLDKQPDYEYMIYSLTNSEVFLCVKQTADGMRVISTHSRRKHAVGTARSRAKYLRGFYRIGVVRMSPTSNKFKYEVGDIVDPNDLDWSTLPVRECKTCDPQSLNHQCNGRICAKVRFVSHPKNTKVYY